MAQVESEQVYDCSSPMLHAILCASVHHVGVVKQEVDFFTKNFATTMSDQSESVAFRR
jgi:hypothetical protein